MNLPRIPEHKVNLFEQIIKCATSCPTASPWSYHKPRNVQLVIPLLPPEWPVGVPDRYVTVSPAPVVDHYLAALECHRLVIRAAHCHAVCYSECYYNPALQKAAV